MPVVYQIELFSAIVKHLKKRHKIECLCTRHLNAIIKASNQIVDELAKEFVPATPGMGLQAWLRSDETGRSSLYMAFVLAPNGCVPGQKDNGEWPPHPHDPDDFGRCVKLLQAAPEFCQHLSMLADGHGEVWKGLISSWDELQAMYFEELPSGSGSGIAPKLYARMREIINRK